MSTNPKKKATKKRSGSGADHDRRGTEQRGVRPHVAAIIKRVVAQERHLLDRLAEYDRGQ